VVVESRMVGLPRHGRWGALPAIDVSVRDLGEVCVVEWHRRCDPEPNESRLCAVWAVVRSSRGASRQRGMRRAGVALPDVAQEDTKAACQRRGPARRVRAKRAIGSLRPFWTVNRPTQTEWWEKEAIQQLGRLDFSAMRDV
jgi:hypothetical protein